MRAARRIAIAWAGWFAVTVAAAMPAQAQDWIAAAQPHMTRLEDALAKLGPARIDDGAFYFGTTKLGSGSATAEDIGRRIGAAYWLFRRDGDEFTDAGKLILEGPGHAVVFGRGDGPVRPGAAP